MKRWHKAALAVVLIAAVLAATLQVLSPRVIIYDPEVDNCHIKAATDPNDVFHFCPEYKTKVGCEHPAIPDFSADTLLLNFGYYPLIGAGLLVATKLLWHNKHKN